jgi:hypothetical protein
MGIGMSTEPESFLTRWSRRKLAAEREAKQPAESVAPEAPAAPPVEASREAGGHADIGPVAERAPDQAAAAQPPLPPIESLDGLRSDYQAFFQQPVAEELRHAALRKLLSDPHFNKMDMLDVYVDDYTQFEPLPAELRLRLRSAREFLLDSERAAVEAAEAPPGAADEAPDTSIAAADGPNATAADEASPDAAAGLADSSSAPTKPSPKSTEPDSSST